jgi:glycosyltransferase involved in cell wall biosynthesis
MNIARIIYDWPPPWSGLAPHPYEVTVSQAKNGHTVDIFCGRWPSAGPIETPEGTTTHAVPREPFMGLLTITSSFLVLFQYLNWRRRHRPDILHAHGHFGIWIFFYRAVLQKFFPWSKELKIPLVVHFHNVAKSRWIKLKEEGKITNPLSEIFVYPMEVFANKLAVTAAAANIFVSESNKQDAIKHYSAEETKCFVVESGINPLRFSPVGAEEKEKSRKDLGLDLYDKVITYHGMLVRRKNPHLLVEALTHLPKNYKLILSGPGDVDYIMEIDELVKKYKFEDRVLQTGYTPYPEAPIAYQVADIFVLPSDWEGLPKTVLEALACGVPALVSGFTFPDEVLGLSYLENLEPKYIAEEIERIAENPVYVDFPLVEGRYSWGERAKQIEVVYDFAKKHYI